MKTFRELISEVAQPKSKDELDFKAKHEIEMLDHPESEEHQHTSEKKGRKRLADYAKGEDMTVYEKKMDPVDHKALKGDFDDREDKDRYMWKDINAALMKAGVPPTTIMRVVSALKGKELKESKMEDSEVLSAAKALAKNGKDAKTKSFGQGLVDYYDENGSFTPAQVGGLQNIMKNASFQLAKESVELSENFKQGSLTLKDGSKVIVSKQNADLLNQMFDGLNPQNRREMLKVAMEDEDGFNEILGFAREAL